MRARSVCIQYAETADTRRQAGTPALRDDPSRRVAIARVRQRAQKVEELSRALSLVPRRTDCLQSQKR